MIDKNAYWKTPLVHGKARSEFILQYMQNTMEWNTLSDDMKALVGRAVCDYVKPGMRLGIGTGSTAEAFVRVLGEKVADGLQIIGVPTSVQTAKLCEALNIPLTTLEETPQLDLTIDGADEVDRDLNLTKGGGGALLREKIVAAASNSMYVIVDEGKMVENLGAFALPIEVNPFGLRATQIAIRKATEDMELKGEIILRQKDGKTFLTDGGHYILDASFSLIRDANALDKTLLAIPGVVQHGLFINMASKVFIAGRDGVKILEEKK